MLPAIRAARRTPRGEDSFSSDVFGRLSLEAKNKLNKKVYKYKF